MPSRKSLDRWTSGWGDRLFRIYVLLYILYVLLPLAVVVLYAFNTSEYLIWPLEGLTLDWFGAALDDSKLMAALTNSLTIATATMVLSIIIGTTFAYGLVRFRFRGKALLETVNVLAIITYGVVSAISVLVWFRTLGIPLGLWATVIAHTTFIMPFGFMVIRDRLLNFDTALEEAAMDLGAGRLRTLCDITIPLITPAIIAAGMFCFTISLGEFLLSLFLNGTDLTLPVYIYSRMRFDFTPSVNAAATMIVSFPILVVILVAIFFRREVRSLF